MRRIGSVGVGISGWLIISILNRMIRVFRMEGVKECVDADTANAAL
jgi:hypothetical protein